MIYLKIDGQNVEIDEKINPAITVGIADIEEPDSSSSGYSKDVEIPFTPHNMAIFGFTNELYSKDQFNNALHTAEYMDDDTIVMCGIVQINKLTYTIGMDGQVVGGYFHVSVAGAALDWVTNAKNLLGKLQSDEMVKYDMDSVYRNSICEDSPLVRFFPVDRGAFYVENLEGEKVARTKIDLKDYHPFMNVWRLIGLILKGYTVRTSLRDVFKKLYCSGSMPESDDLTYIKEDNEFYIGTSVDDDPTEDAGSINFKNREVWLDLYDSWESDKYNNDKGVIKAGYWKRPRFMPTETAVVQLETNLHYSTQIMNGSIDGVSNDLLEPSGECFYVNRFQQFVGDHVETVVLTLDQCLEVKDKGGSIKELFLPSDANQETTYVVYMRYDHVEDLSVSFSHPRIRDRKYIGNIKRGDNWYVVKVPQYSGSGVGDFYIGRGMYPFPAKDYLSDFYFFEIYDNKVTFDVSNVTRNAYTLQKGFGYQIYVNFSCSHKYGPSPRKSDAKLYIHKNNSIKPTFVNLIGDGDEVGISTIGGTTSQMDFLSALRQMFNLMFYTNPLTKEVFIEPRTRFYNRNWTNLIDWRDKIDYSREVVVEGLGEDMGNALKLSYADGSDAVKRHNWETKTELGVYTTPLLNKTMDEVKELANSMFSPFIERSIESVGMTVPQDAPKKTKELINDVDLDITPIIGYFDRLETRTAGEDCDPYASYPRLVFQDAKRDVNLGFEDIAADDVVVEGLNRYYQDNISCYNHGRRLTVYMHILPQDIEAILIPNGQKRDLRGVFLLRHDGEDVPCLLECISDYNPTDGCSTKCQFVVDRNIRLMDRVVVKRNRKVVTYGNTAIEYKCKVG